MQKDPEDFQKLFQLYLSNQCSPEQMKKLFEFIKRNNSNKLLLKGLNHEFEGAFQGEDFHEKPILTELHNRQNNQVLIPVYKMTWLKYAAAAVILFMLSIGSYWLIRNHNVHWDLVKNDPAIMPAANISPGSNKAVLTLDNGQNIILDSVNTGVIALQGSSQIIKNKNGLIKYDSTSQTDNPSIFYNSVSTPIGGQYQLILPDESKVWLNAASSIRFPTRFTGHERKVEITGEVYFEVAKNAKMPFKVSINDKEEIEVLGTHFNVMAYSDESSIKATLLEGAIKIKNQSTVNFIKPGQQAILRSKGNIEIIENVNLDHEIAWKNGLFDFDNDNLPDIMRRLSRWYNVEIVYTGEIPKGHYMGAVRRQSSIMNVLKMLELAGDVKFSIVGNKILVKEN